MPKVDQREVRVVLDRQWSLPAGYHRSTWNLITLRELTLSPETAVKYTELAPEKLAKLVAARIEAQPRFEIMMVGVGVVDKERAVREVLAQSRVGEALIEIERVVLRRVTEAAVREAAGGE
jgi:hypothetical protein